MLISHFCTNKLPSLKTGTGSQRTVTTVNGSKFQGCNILYADRAMH